MKYSNILSIAILAFSSVCALTGCSTLASNIDMNRALSGISKAGQALAITDSQMASLVAQEVAYMDKQNTVLSENDAYTVRLRNLTSGLTQVDGIPLNFKVYATKEVNAFACPDGSVRVYTGLMDLMADNEVLGVIGHEIGHVALKHSKKAMQQALINSALLDGVASTNSTVAVLTDSQLGSLAQSLLSAKFSKSQESEADDFGYEFLKGAGKNPWAMAMAFEKMLQLEQSNGEAVSGLQKMFSSHPNTQTRINNMSKRAQQDGYKRPSSSATSTSTTTTKSGNKSKSGTSKSSTSWRIG